MVARNGLQTADRGQALQFYLHVGPDPREKQYPWGQILSDHRSGENQTDQDRPGSSHTLTSPPSYAFVMPRAGRAPKAMAVSQSPCPNSLRPASGPLSQSMPLRLDRQLAFRESIGAGPPLLPSQVPTPDHHTPFREFSGHSLARFVASRRELASRIFGISVLCPMSASVSIFGDYSCWSCTGSIEMPPYGQR